MTDSTLQLCILASGSKANCLYLRWGNTRVLVDAGLGIRTLLPSLQSVGARLDNITAIFLTHEHADHARALRHLLPKWKGWLCASEGTLAALDPVIPVRCTTAPVAGEFAEYGTITVRAIPVSHDAAQPVAFEIIAGPHRLAIATDLGEVSAELLDALHRSSCIVLESNHDEQMLETGPYPQLLKDRIRSRTGHLSNRQTADALATLRGNGLQTVVLAHLSEENNDPSLALAAASTALEGDAAVIHVTARSASGPFLRFDSLEHKTGNLSCEARSFFP